MFQSKQVSENTTKKDYFPTLSNIDYTKNTKTEENNLTSDISNNSKMEDINYIPQFISYTKEPKSQSPEDILQYAQSKEIWQREAKKGNALAQFNMGCCYYNGSHGLNQNYEKAINGI